MAIPLPDELDSMHAWAIRYLIDWRACGPMVRPVRLYTTLIRWFHTPNARVRQLGHALAWLGRTELELPPQLQLNLTDLLENNLRLGPSWPAAPFGLFLASLTDGDLVAGGPTDADLHPDLALARPGFAYLVSKWRRHFESIVPPWPYWMFPTPARIVRPA